MKMRSAMRTIGYVSLGAGLALAYALFGVAHPKPVLRSATAATVVDVAAPRALTADQHGWRPVWHADFSGSRPSWRQWQWFDGRLSQTNLAHYTADAANSYTRGGTLQIRALRDRMGRWTSARLQSRQKFRPPPNGSLKITADVLFPNAGHGYFPAVWMLGANWNRVGWPRSGEFDLAETIGGSATVIGDLHCGSTTTGGPCHESRGLVRHVAIGGHRGWHHYVFVWNTHPARITWSVDGRLQTLLTPADIGKATWRQTFNHPYNILANVAIGGIWPGPPDHTTRSGGTLSVRNLTVYTNRRGGTQ
jgi:beta-glucanase (GH16 family)